MTDIKLINEDGVIKGVDIDTGEEVPIELDESIIRGLTLADDLDADGHDIEGVQSLTTEVVDTVAFAVGIGDFVFASNYDTLHAAINDVGNGSTVIVDGEFDEAITVSQNDVTLWGLNRGRSGITSDDADQTVEMDGFNQLVINCNIQNTGPGNAITISNRLGAVSHCSVQDHIQIDVDECMIINNDLSGNDVTVSNSSGGIIDGNIRSGTITADGYTEGDNA